MPPVSPQSKTTENKLSDTWIIMIMKKLESRSRTRSLLVENRMRRTASGVICLNKTCRRAGTLVLAGGRGGGVLSCPDLLLSWGTMPGPGVPPAWHWGTPYLGLGYPLSDTGVLPTSDGYPCLGLGYPHL